MKTTNGSIQEIQALTESEKLYRINERIEEMHLSNGDFKAALADKWRLAINYGGNH